MALPEKDYFKISEIAERWNCPIDQIIQFVAAGKLCLHSLFTGYGVAVGNYRWPLPYKKRFGSMILALLKHYKGDMDLINIYSVHDNLGYYRYNFQAYRKDQVTVHLLNSISGNEEPITLKLGDHYDVNLADNSVVIYPTLTNYIDHISITPSFENSLKEISAYLSKDFEKLRNDDVKFLLSKETVQIEFLHQENSEVGYFKCLIEGIELPLPYIGINDLYLSREERDRFEKEHAMITISELDKSATPPPCLTIDCTDANPLSRDSVTVKDLISGLRTIKNDILRDGKAFTVGNLVEWILESTDKNNPGNNSETSINITGFEDYYIVLNNPREKDKSKRKGKLHWKDRKGNSRSRSLRSLERILLKV